MPSFSATSRRRLSTTTYGMQEIFRRLIPWYDCSVLEGHRTKTRQNKLFNSKHSKVQWPNSKHNTNPSTAVDAGPYLPGKKVPWPKTPSDWNNSVERNAYIKDLAQFYHFAGAVEATAYMLGTPIRWGGDWDRDHDLSDQTFDDLVHFEEAKRR